MECGGRGGRKKDEGFSFVVFLGRQRWVRCGNGYQQLLKSGQRQRLVRKAGKRWVLCVAGRTNMGGWAPGAGSCCGAWSERRAGKDSASFFCLAPALLPAALST